MTEILVDSNVILDVLTEDPQWFEWSAQMLTDYANQGNLVINPIIYAEISIGFNQPEEPIPGGHHCMKRVAQYRHQSANYLRFQPIEIFVKNLLIGQIISYCTQA